MHDLARAACDWDYVVTRFVSCAEQLTELCCLFADTCGHVPRAGLLGKSMWTCAHMQFNCHVVRAGVHGVLKLTG